MIDQTYYVTTPIYYVNDVPHIGNAYPTVHADVMSRYEKLKGMDVFFLTGTDENATKVAAAARDKGVPVQDYVDQLTDQFKLAWSKPVSYTHLRAHETR